MSDDFRMIDKKTGVWVRSTSEFGLADHGRQETHPGSALIVLQPGQATKIDLNGYLRGQPTLEVLTVDPISGEDIVEKVAPAKVEKK